MRRLIQRWFPRLAAKIEAESRSWMIQCPACHHEISVWDAGGVRYKAAGRKYTYGRCPACRKRGMMKLYRRREATAA